MIAGKANFLGGVTLRKRVSPDEPASMARISGWETSDGYLTPEKMAKNLLTGSAPPTPLPRQAPYAFTRAGATVVLARDHYRRLREFSAGAWGSPVVLWDVPEEAVPVRYGPLVVYPTKGERARVMAYESDSPSRKYRPLSMEDPDSYQSGTKPTVVPSSAQGALLFDLVDGGTEWRLVHSGGGPTGVDPAHPDYQPLQFLSTCPSDELMFACDLGDTGVELLGKKYLVLDLILKYAGTNPASAIVSSGDFVNSHQTTAGSGFEFVLYSDRSSTQEMRRYSIPKLDTTGLVNRVVFHLGTLAETTPGHITVKGLGVRTADDFVPPAVSTTSTHYYVLWVYSYPFDDDWEFQGNLLLPETVWDKSPWQLSLPPDPGEEGTSAVVLERFPESKTEFYPAHPRLRYAYCFAAKDRLGTTYHRYMTSNPSDWSADVFADPWRTYTVTVALPADEWGETFITDYGAYGTHALLYRATATGTQLGEIVWDEGAEPFIKALTIAASMSYLDPGGEDPDPLIGQVAVPDTLELSKDWAPAARYAATMGKRVALGCLGYDAETDTWQRKTAIAISTFEQPWAFPTISTENDPASIGGELDDYAQTGTELRGILGRDDHWVVWLDNECFWLLGDSPNSWHPVRRGPVGLISFLSVADCATTVIWHAGDHFYQFVNGAPVPISEGIINSKLIDWTSAHSAEYADRKYRFHCRYDGEWSVLTYDLARQAWRIRPSAAYDLVGICAPDARGPVYGVRPDGRVVDLFAADSDYGAESTQREARTQYMAVAPPGTDIPILRAVIEALTEEGNEETLYVTARTLGEKVQSQSREIHVSAARSTYEARFEGITGSAVSIEVSYPGTKPPSLLFIGVEAAEVAVG